MEQRDTVVSIFFDGAWYCVIPFFGSIFDCVGNCAQEKLEEVSSYLSLDSLYCFFLDNLHL